MPKKFPMFAALFVLIACLCPRLAAGGEGEGILSYLQPVKDAAKYKGRVAKYAVNGITIHTYASEEAYRDWTIIFETEDSLILLEPQSMPASSLDCRNYVLSIGKPLAGVIVSYHGVGPDSFPGVPIYATTAAIEYVRSGRYEKGLRQFAKQFPDCDVKVIVPTLELKGGKTAVGGVEFVPMPDDKAYPMPGADFGLPAHKVAYLHMLGGDTHSIVNSIEEIDVFINYLKKLREEGYEVFICSHHMPETGRDVDAKIAYLVMLKEVAASATTRDEFIAEMLRRAPDKKGSLYLGMTAGNLFK